MNFNIDSIKKNKIELLDCQVEIILKSLEYYCYSTNFLFDRKRKYELKETNLQICLITDTYHQILNQFGNSKINNPIINNSNTFDVSDKKFKKFA